VASTGASKWFVFLVITPLKLTGNTELLTGLSIIKTASHVAQDTDIAHAQAVDQCGQEIIGLPALHPRDNLYMVPFTSGTGGRHLATVAKGDVELDDDTELLYVDWCVHFG
jgi:hypothetical protein